MKRITRTIERRAFSWSLALALMVAAATVLPAEQVSRGAPTAELVAGMVAFDKAYIPVLALSNQNKPEASLKAMTILKSQWADFSRRFAASYPEADWTRGFDRTAAVLLRAEEQLKKGDPAAAHIVLEEVRDIFVELRAARSIAYYVDFLNHYHGSMEEVTAVTAGRTAAAVGQDQVRSVGSLLPVARAKWEATLAAPFDAAAFGFSAARVEELKKAEQAVLQGIGQVEKALETGDREALVRTVEAMKPVFTRTFLMFGDFEKVNR
jgi:hypothetical protein